MSSIQRYCLTDAAQRKPGYNLARTKGVMQTALSSLIFCSCLSHWHAFAFAESSCWSICAHIYPSLKVPPLFFSSIKETPRFSFILELSYHHKQREEQLNQRGNLLEPASQQGNTALLRPTSRVLELLITIQHQLTYTRIYR